MIAVNVARHAGNIALAPFVLVGLRAQEKIEKHAKGVGSMENVKIDKRKRGAVPPLEPRECDQCKKIFVPTRRNQVVCGDECRVLRARELSRDLNRKRRNIDLSPRPCEVCGEIFTPKRVNEKCCSDACKGAYMLENSRKNMLNSYYGVPSAGLEKRRAFLVKAIAAYQADLDKINAILGDSQPETREGE